MRDDNPSMTELQKIDRVHVWHPFTKLANPLQPPSGSGDPLIVITRASGAILCDENGKEYLDGNASIWTCLHGHGDERLTSAVCHQLQKLDHCSALGLANDQAALLAAELVEALNLPEGTRVFFSSDGSSAIEAGLKILHQARQLRGEGHKKKFLNFCGSYHGDTVGAMSLSHSPLFHRPFAEMMFDALHVPAPACYRCPHNRALPEKGADARLTRKCHWECVRDLERVITSNEPRNINAAVIEPRVQGAAGFLMHPRGYQQKIRPLLEEHDIWLMTDEILTGMGRCGPLLTGVDDGAHPQIVALGKSLSGGVLPLAATLIAPEVAGPFSAPDAPIFYHGHSYSGNPPACAAARASLQMLRGKHNTAHRKKFASILAEASKIFWQHDNVGDVRHEGGIVAIELVEDFASRKPFPAYKRVGAAVCAKAAELGLLTRPVGDCLVLMPPLCATEEQIEKMCQLLSVAIKCVLNK
jgi:adenosylmethionine-8-amino-7-oxononanoate aminotransferase